MADPRPKHFHYPTTLLNERAPESAAQAIYGARGPRAAAPDYGPRGRKPLSGPPQSLEHHVADALARVKDLSPKQRLALRNTMMTMFRDVSFLKMALEQAKAMGPWSEQAVTDSQGNAYSAG
jgi:hypothetical protein